MRAVILIEFVISSLYICCIKNKIEVINNITMIYTNRSKEKIHRNLRGVIYVKYYVSIRKITFISITSQCTEPRLQEKNPRKI